jgi:hypothetical protein
MKPRVTINLASNGELEIWLNPEGRDPFVKELQALSKRNEHFHMGTEDEYFEEIELSKLPYNPNDKILTWAKVLFRTDEWDRQYFPHVFGPESEEESN